MVENFISLVREGSEWYHCWDEKYPIGEYYHCGPHTTIDGHSLAIHKNGEIITLHEWRSLSDNTDMSITKYFSPDNVDYDEVNEVFEIIRENTYKSDIIRKYRKEYIKELKSYNTSEKI